MARKHVVPEGKYLDPRTIQPRDEAPDLYDVAMLAPQVIMHYQDSAVQKKSAGIDWSLYKIVFKDNNPVVQRTKCDRCAKVDVPPAWRKFRAADTEIGPIYLETGLCKDCINASIFMDKYLDGEPTTFSESLDIFNEYAAEFEKAWRIVLVTAPDYVMTEEEWQRRCTFFNGCAMCGGNIEVRAKYFPSALNGKYAPWNVLPLCKECYRNHMRGRNSRKKQRYRVFCAQQTFQKHKEIRVYLMNVMDKYGIDNDLLLPFRKRFREVKKVDDRFL